jgi:hypothetical protein
MNQNFLLKMLKKNQFCRTKTDIVVWADQTSCGIQVGGELVSFFIIKMSHTYLDVLDTKISDTAREKNLSALYLDNC